MFIKWSLYLLRPQNRKYDVYNFIFNLIQRSERQGLGVSVVARVALRRHQGLHQSRPRLQTNL